MYPFHITAASATRCTGTYKNGLCRYYAHIAWEWIDLGSTSREATLTVSLSSINGAIATSDIQAIAGHCCQQLCRDGPAPEAARIEILGFRWADQLSLGPGNGIATLAQYEAKQLLQNGYSDVCLQAKVTKDGVVRIIQAKKQGTMMQAAFMPGQSVLAQSWQAV
jgi:hypothetical protein